MNPVVSTKPYLIRAIYEWCVDCGYTPYVSVKVDANTKVPHEYVKEGEIVLNVGQTATRNLKIDNDRIHFSARFNGVSREISVPIETVSGIFARENGEGLMFKMETLTPQVPAPVGPQTLSPNESAAVPTKAPVARSHLKLIK